MADQTQKTPITMDDLMQLFQQLNSKQIVPPPPPPAWTVSPSLNIPEKLNNQNYTIWSRVIKLDIDARGRLKHIMDDSPSQTDPEYPKWKQEDSMVISWIIKNIDSTLVNQYLDYPTARDLWKAIEATYSDGADELQIFDLMVRSNTTQQGEDPIEVYYGKMVGLWKEIDRRMPNPMECAKDKDTHNEITHRMRLYQFLAGLNNGFDRDRREILLQKPLPSVDSAYAFIRREITRRGVMNKDTTDEIGSGMAVKSRSTKFPAKKVEDKSNLQCTHCGGTRHTKEGCFKLIGYPDWWTENKKKGVRGKAAMAEESKSSGREEDERGVREKGKETQGFFSWTEGGKKGG